MNYVVIYDPLYSLEFGKGPWLIMLLLTIPAALGAWRPSLLRGRPRSLSQPARILLVLGPTIAFLWISLVVTADGYNQKRLFEAGDFTFTEGAVHGFTPVGDHRPARFDLHGVPFSYYGSLGAPIHDGMQLRISHRGGTILRVEALRDRLG